MFTMTIHAKFMKRMPRMFCTLSILLVVLATADCTRLHSGLSTDSFKLRRLDTRADQAMVAGDYAASIELHKRVLKLQPNDPLNLYHLGFAYGQTGDVANEILFYRQAIDAGMTANDELYFNLGMAYGERQQLQEALAAFERGMAVDPQSAENHFGAGLAYEALEQFSAAESLFLSAARLDPRHIESRLHLARLYIKLGDKEKADNQLNQVLEIDPQNRSAIDLRRQLN